MPNAIQTSRHHDALAQLDRVANQRDATITKLLRLETKIKTLRRQITRYEKLAAKPQSEPKPQPAPAIEREPLPAALVAEFKAETDDLSIPGFLRRNKEADKKDAEAAAAIRQEQADRKKAKARGRIEKLKAKQRGDLKRMPLEGKAALAAIREG